MLYIVGLKAGLYPHISVSLCDGVGLKTQKDVSSTFSHMRGSDYR